MSRFDFSNYKLDEADGVFTFKNENTTLGFVDLMTKVKWNTFLLTQFLEKRVLLQNYCN